MYLCFKTKEIDGILAPFPYDSLLSEKPIDGYICLDENDSTWKNYYTQSEGKTIWHLWNGWNNIPQYKFDMQKWENGENPFRKYDFSKSETLKKWLRRKHIERDINRSLSYGTENKKMRKALKAIIVYLSNNDSNIASLPEVEDFLSYSQFVEDTIYNKFEKESTISTIDVKKENGEIE